MKPLDFLIIGAQKCATTTLFEHLRKHPAIHMPLEKELPFFTSEDCTETAWSRFADRYFGAEDGRLWGKATPQYMCDPLAAERIHSLMPDVKLVAILRDPIERTISHYQMGRRRNTEERTLEAMTQALLEPASLQQGRTLPVPTHSAGYEPESDFYIAWSEYGRILQRYRALFDADQLLVLYTEDLERDPQATLDRLIRFIGLAPGYRPDSLGAVIHKGGASNKIPNGLRVWLRERRWLYRLWQMVPADWQGALRFRYEQWNVRKQVVGAAAIPEASFRALSEHFAGDLERLLSLPVETPPWAKKYRLDSQPAAAKPRKLQNSVVA